MNFAYRDLCLQRPPRPWFSCLSLPGLFFKFYHICVVLQTFELYISTILDVLFCSFLFLLNFMFLRSIHAVSEALFHYLVLLHHSIVWVPHDLFSLSTVDGYLGDFQYFVSTMMLLWASCIYLLWNYLGYISGDSITGWKALQSLLGNQKLLFKMICIDLHFHHHGMNVLISNTWCCHTFLIWFFLHPLSFGFKHHCWADGHEMFISSLCLSPRLQIIHSTLI